MKRAIIVHGMPDKDSYFDIKGDSQSNSHWLPWLQQQLCARDILTQTPEMPQPYSPVYDQWQEEFKRYQPERADLLVGHSCGGGFILRWLTEKRDKVPAKIVLVAPWLDIESAHSPLFDFVLPYDIADYARRGIDMLVSTDDSKDILRSVAHINQRVENIRCHEFTKHGHFTLSSMNRREFPDLLNICLAA